MPVLAVAQDNLFPTRTLEVPAYLPEELRERLAGVRLRVVVPKGARRRVRTAEKIAPSVWNERFRRVPVGEASPGPWRREYAPHLPEIIDLFWQPHVREFWYCGPERDAKTNFLLSIVGPVIDMAPGNIYYLMPSEEKAKQIVSEKLRPMLEESPRLARHLGENKRIDITQSLIRLTNGVRIFPAHARSATSLATFSARVGLGDEVDKYEETVGKETDAITLLKKRLREFRNCSKLGLASTPAGKFIYKGAKSCQLVLVTEIRCPACGEYHRAGEEGLVIPDGATVEGIKAGEVEIRQACTACGYLMDDTDMDHARRNFRLAAIKGEKAGRAATVGLLRTAWDCVLVPLVEIAIAKLKADGGGIAEKRDYAHGYKCEDCVEEEKQRSDEEILVLCDERPAGVVPAVPVVALLLTVDTQANHFWYVLRAHGYGMDQESWLVRCGQLQTFEAIERLMYEVDFFDAAGMTYRVTNVAIDTGGTKAAGEDTSRTYQVYDWARNHPMVYPFKGATRQAAPFRVSHVDFFPDTNKPIPGGLKLYNVNSNFYKDELSRRLLIPPTDPGAFHLHSGFEAHHLQEAMRPASNLREYARHMTAEFRDDRGQWLPLLHRRHDLWDCEVYQVALADILDLRYELAPEERAARREERVENRKPERVKTSKPRRW